MHYQSIQSFSFFQNGWTYNKASQTIVLAITKGLATPYLRLIKKYYEIGKAIQQLSWIKKVGLCKKVKMHWLQEESWQRGAGVNSKLKRTEQKPLGSTDGSSAGEPRLGESIDRFCTAMWKKVEGLRKRVWAWCHAFLSSEGKLPAHTKSQQISPDSISVKEEY